MYTNVRTSRLSQLTAWVIACTFILGWFIPAVGLFTAPISGTWFAGTQKPLRGFCWMMIFSLPGVLFTNRTATLIGHDSFPSHLLLVITCICGILPFTFHRLTSRHLPGIVSTFPLPLAGIAMSLLEWKTKFSPSFSGKGSEFVSYWLAAVIVWMWNREEPALKTCAVFAVSLTAAVFYHLHSTTVEAHPLAPVFGWICIGGVLIFAGWALASARVSQSWAQKSRALAKLRSPYSGSPLQVFSQHGREILVSAAGEQFPIQGGIPVFLRSHELVGDNRKYRRLYEAIGGFYDDIQRVFAALRGWDRNAYFRSYIDLLEVNPGDSVLETSVGTGLNFKYLPRDVALSGLDLSAEMLVNCKENLRRWKLKADLYMGNAEILPFVDNSFDVVFHVGGINFFNDRAQAIREMIRVAKPGSLLLIADETEKHVKDVYEKMPGGLYKDRKEPVEAPISLIPPEMEETELKILRDGQFYALTFRKPICDRLQNNDQTIKASSILSTN